MLLVGGLGQLGQGLAEKLRQKFGRDGVLLTDIKKPSPEVLRSGKHTVLVKSWVGNATGPRADNAACPGPFSDLHSQ